MTDQDDSALKISKHARGKGGCRWGRMRSNCCHEEENENNLSASSACTVSSLSIGLFNQALPLYARGSFKLQTESLLQLECPLQNIYRRFMFISKIGLHLLPVPSPLQATRECPSFPSSLLSQIPPGSPWLSIYRRGKEQAGGKVHPWLILSSKVTLCSGLDVCLKQILSWWSWVSTDYHPHKQLCLWLVSPGSLQFKGSQKVRHHWAYSTKIIFLTPTSSIFL